MTGALVFFAIVCRIGFLACAVFHGRHINLVLALLFLASCRHEVKVGVPVTRDDYVYVMTQRANLVRYTIAARSQAALDAAMIEIGCVQKVCVIERAGSLFVVERQEPQD